MFLIPTSKQQFKTISPSVRAILAPKGMPISEKKIHKDVKVIVALKNIEDIVIITAVNPNTVLFSPSYDGGFWRVRSYERKTGESDFKLLKRLYKSVCLEEPKIDTMPEPIEEAKIEPGVSLSASVTATGRTKALTEERPVIEINNPHQILINTLIDRSIKDSIDNLFRKIESDLVDHVSLFPKRYILVAGGRNQDLENAREEFSRLLNKDDLVIEGNTLTFVARRH